MTVRAVALTLATFAALPAVAQDAATAPAPATAAPATTAAPAATPAAPAATTAAAPAPAGDVSGTYTFDPDHSQILYTYDHMGFSKSTGMVRGVTGTVTLDQADPSKSSVEASFPLSGLMTVSKTLDEHMMGDQFFKGAPGDTAVTFKSTSVAVDDEDEAKVTGDLTLNGVTKPVTLEVDLRKLGPNPMSNAPAAGFEAETTIKRSEFGLGAFAPAVGDEVEIKINVEAKKG